MKQFISKIFVLSFCSAFLLIFFAAVGNSLRADESTNYYQYFDLHNKSELNKTEPILIITSKRFFDLSTDKVLWKVTDGDLSNREIQPKGHSILKPKSRSYAQGGSFVLRYEFRAGDDIKCNLDIGYIIDKATLKLRERIRLHNQKEKCSYFEFPKLIHDAVIKVNVHPENLKRKTKTLKKDTVK